MKYFFIITFLSCIILSSCSKDNSLPPLVLITDSAIDRSGVYSGMMQDTGSWGYFIDLGFYLSSGDTSFLSQITVSQIGADSIEFQFTDVNADGSVFNFTPSTLVFAIDSNASYSDVHYLAYTYESQDFHFSGDTLVYSLYDSWKFGTIYGSLSALK